MFTSIETIEYFGKTLTIGITEEGQRFHVKEDRFERYCHTNAPKWSEGELSLIKEHIAGRITREELSDSLHIRKPDTITRRIKEVSSAK